MGLLDRLKRKNNEVDPPQQGSTTCNHTRLVPHWANLQDMGERERVTYYQCEACRVEIGREDGQALMQAYKDNSGPRRPS